MVSIQTIATNSEKASYLDKARILSRKPRKPRTDIATGKKAHVFFVKKAENACLSLTSLSEHLQAVQAVQATETAARGCEGARS